MVSFPPPPPPPFLLAKLHLWIQHQYIIKLDLFTKSVMKMGSAICSTASILG
jgi:hypothetical protein